MGQVLVIDDELSICDIIGAILVDEGHRIATAHDGAEGLRLLQQMAFDLILLDINMPIMNGWEFLAAYQHLPDPRPPVVVCTAQRAGFGDKKELGRIGLLLKPFDIDDLLNIVGQHISSKPLQ